MANFTGTRSTKQIISEARNVREVAPKIYYLEPDIAPIITLLSKMNKKRPTPQVKFSQFEGTYTARWAQVSATTASTTSETTIYVQDYTQFVAGDMLILPRAVSDGTTPELIRVTAVNSGGYLTVTRGVGSTTTGTIAAAAALTFAGTAYNEGAAFPDVKSAPKTEVVSYTQIFRTALSLTNTSRAVKAYGMDELNMHRFEKAKEHKIQLNRALLFGVASEDTSGTTPLRTTMGINSAISTNKYDAGGTLTRRTIELFAQQAFRYGNKNQKILLCSPTVASAFNQFAQSQLMISPQDKTYGVTVQKVVTGHGEWLLVKDWELENGISGKNGFGGTALSLDLDSIEMRYLNDNGVSRDTKYLEDVVQDGVDAKRDEYLSEIGFMVRNEKFHAKLFNVTDWAA